MQLHFPAASKMVVPPRRLAWLALGLALLLGLSRGATVAHAGAALAWGSNGNGQLGDTTTMPRNLPVPVHGVANSGYLTGVKAVAMGASHSLALMSTGAVYAWGDNSYGQLGDGTTTQRLTPVAVSGLGASTINPVIAIAAGANHSLAVKRDGSVVAWGYNYDGELGDGTTTTSAPYGKKTPVAVNTLGSGVTAIAAGQSHSLAVQSGGVFAWGYNVYGQLGDGTTTQRTSPVAVMNLGSGVTAVAAGGNHSLALQSGGVFAWGYNNDGELGDGTTTTSAPYGKKTPVAVNTLGSGVTAIAAGQSHSLAVQSGGVFAWGYNVYGQLGDGTTTQRTSPVAVMNLGSGVTAVAAGGNHSLALQSGGVFAWGNNGYGQLGDGTSGTNRLTPVAVQNASNTGPLTNISAIGTGLYANHSLAVQGTPTYVTLMSFDATRYSHVLWLNWQTGLEVDNLGFNVYREVKGKKVRLNGNDLIAGSAIQTGANSGCTYAWPDALIPGAKYWLEDVDLSGTSTWHGPITPRPGIGSAGALRRSPVLGQGN